MCSSHAVVGQTGGPPARLEQMADTRYMLTTRDTFLVEGYVAMQALGRMPVKGLADLVEVYEVTSAGHSALVSKCPLGAA